MQAWTCTHKRGQASAEGRQSRRAGPIGGQATSEGRPGHIRGQGRPHQGAGPIRGQAPSEGRGTKSAPITMPLMHIITPFSPCAFGLRHRHVGQPGTHLHQGRPAARLLAWLPPLTLPSSRPSSLMAWKVLPHSSTWPPAAASETTAGGGGVVGRGAEIGWEAAERLKRWQRLGILCVGRGMALPSVCYHRLHTTAGRCFPQMLTPRPHPFILLPSPSHVP